MATLVSEMLGGNESDFDKLGVFDAVIGVDTRLFVDPFLLNKTKVPELKNSRNRIKKYYEDIITLLLASKSIGDIAWKEAYKRLIFRELKGVSIGYGAHSSDGSAIGPVLAKKLVKTASEIVNMGIKDPNIFELIGLFEEDFGADRLSDMTLRIIKEDVFRYTERVTKELNIVKTHSYKIGEKEFTLPISSKTGKPVILLPKEILRDLPVALTWEGIDHVVAVNNELRQRLNRLIGTGWRSKIKKQELRDIIFTKKENVTELLDAYKNSSANNYDFEKDPAGQVNWYKIGRKYAEDNPLNLEKKHITNIEQLKDTLRKIANQFKRNIEVNGLNEHLYVKQGNTYKRRHERYSQLLFFAIADSYCEANDTDLNREPNAGSGPVDFKVSKGYNLRGLVEIKLSSNPSVTKGYEKQITAYEQSERTTTSFYLVIKVTKSERKTALLIKRYEEKIQKGETAPELIIIDGVKKPTASKRK
ncbi:hypothetical protein A2572_04765 [Candidatus Collierbacteria bacterium RIFOXYD1_FULL_40_9]|uniref:Uncharacterized protein n=1 Tax=Candidatus Collierbacteria bacterium RIFOXYD1_FULL_40_9 TaxID=1817731 RepID=A0A1F5FVG3_9BACT|nr:MAG: hypothetical protein A2572_04765 [Candidatus Collierbacteria bacterium RIFOXYD1_FULL_40_9]